MATSAGTKSEHLLDHDDILHTKSSQQRRAHETVTSDETGGENGILQTVAGVMGNVLEWYDFALFGFFSDVIATVFFAPSDAPEDDDYIDMGGEIDASNLVRSFAVYGGAFLMRPVGGLLIGSIGDRYGRKRALVLSLFLMAFPTFLM